MKKEEKEISKTSKTTSKLRPIHSPAQILSREELKPFKKYTLVNPRDKADPKTRIMMLGYPGMERDKLRIVRLSGPRRETEETIYLEDYGIIPTKRGEWNKINYLEKAKD